MGRKIHDRYPAARAAFERAEAVLSIPVRRLCFEGPEQELNRTDLLQPCVMTCSWAADEVWSNSYGMDDVKVMAGHSLGEFTALAAAGAISWETALLLVKERGEIMSRAAEERPGAMIAIVDLDQPKIEEILAEAGKSGKLYMANRNANVQFVLSGELPAVQEAERLALAAGARRALILTIPLAAHSPLMAKAGAAFKKVVDQLDISVPAIPILANATGNPIRTVDALRSELANHLLRPVDWMRTMHSMQRMQVKTVVELGPGRVLASLAAKHIPGVDTWNAEELFIDYVDTPREVPA
jgi:[acyl-carrier-protein] S-malonyltransferase